MGVYAYFTKCVLKIQYLHRILHSKREDGIHTKNVSRKIGTIIYVCDTIYTNYTVKGWCLPY